MGARLPLVAVLALAILSCARAEASDPEFEVAIRSVEFGARHDFPLPRGYANWGDWDRTNIRPVFTIKPLRGSPILGAIPGLRLVSMRGADGIELIAGDVRGTVDASYYERPRYLFSGDSASLPTAARCEPGMPPGELSIPMARLPAGLGVVEGEIKLQVVTRDETAEFVMGDGPEEHTLAPGVRMLTDPRGGPNGQALAQYFIDADPTDGPAPILNFATYSCGQMRDLIPFKPFRGWDQIRARAQFHLQCDQRAPTTVFAHLVYGARTVSVPFRFGDVPITKFVAPQDAPVTRPAPSQPEVVTTTDGYEVRLVRVIVRGSQQIGRFGESKRSVKVLFRVGVRDLSDSRSFGRYLACRLESIVDEFDRPAGEPALTRCDDDRGTGGGMRFLPVDAIALEGHAASRRSEAARMALLTVPFDQIPPVLGAVRGRVEFAEATGSFTAEADLKPSENPIELGPGVRLVVREPVPMPNVLPTQPPSDWVAVEVDLPSDAPRHLDESSTPRVNLVQFYGPDGKPQHAEYSYGFRRVGNRLVYAIGQRAYLEKSTRVRVQIITSSTLRSLPFEFRNIPCGGR